MTGDGVNDAPSIRSADIGIGMGVSRVRTSPKASSDMVLADDNFATIVSSGAEKAGRIYANIRKTIQFLLASNLSEVLTIFTAAVLSFTVLKPAHLLWINLITDCLPAVALGCEAAEPDVMSRPPRDPKDGIFAGGMGISIVYQSVVITVLTLAAYFIGHYMESGVWQITTSADGMTMAFVTLSLTEILHSVNMRSRTQSLFSLDSRNNLLWVAALGSLALTAAVIYIPPFAAAFGFEHISLVEFLVALALAVAVIPIVELEKFINRKRAQKHR